MTTQRDRLAAAVHPLLHDKGDLWPVTTDCGCEAWADALLSRGVRVVDAKTLSEAHHRAECEPVPSHDEPDEFDKKVGNAMMRRLLVS